MSDKEIPRIPMTTEEIEAASIGGAPKLIGQVTLWEYDPRWPQVFERETARMHERLSHIDHRIEHVGSTSVPDLPAKPVIDMLLIVPDSADEAAYAPALEGIGFELVIREPEWYEHRVLRKHNLAPSADSANLHVLSEGCPEARRMLLFRDRLRTHSGDRELYADTKRSLSRQTWEYMQNYADAKTEVVEGILKRAVTGDR
ncbi:GrpB family protein [Streptomyces sp. 4503]|uniref:GrpB family protein n=1 Tax=Streptomyces niphimycinicus TaxID=2842201 RepID=A0ABS6CFQ2_9ACTN|nr:GrpB family protein [Streptomyces niphimycinicus]MBU3865760.1 GrpB family protein [Streptomyces niphimycinicus]